MIIMVHLQQRVCEQIDHKMLSRRLFVLSRSVAGRRVALVQSVVPAAQCMEQSLQTSTSPWESVSVRSFHTSTVVAAKAKKGGSKKGDDEESGGAQLPNIADTKKSMEIIVDRFSVELGKLKVGKASADIFRDIQVGSYGSVSSAGQVTVKSASSVAIAVYDPTMVKTVADAIKDCGLGFAPTIENSTVSVFIPKPSKESRDALAKSAGQLGEKVFWNFLSFIFKV